VDEREYLVKAQEADAIANAATNPRLRQKWEDIALQFRKLARAETELRELGQKEER
jgi:hypothetical protein